MNSRLILIGFIGILVVIVSIWLGTGLATNQVETLLIVGGAVGFIVCLSLGQKIWIAMIMLIAMPVPIIRGFFAPDLGMMAFIGMSGAIFMVRKIKLHWSFTEMDFWRFMLAACIIQVYLRNPVGLNMFGASAVGARPYFNVVIALVAGFILSKYFVHPKEIRLAMWASIVGSIITLPLNTLRYGFGRGPAIESVEVTAGYEAEGATRIGKYNTWAQALSVIISSRISPLRACFHPGWALLILVAFALAALSGYRNTVAYVGLIFLLGIAYRGGFLAVVASATTGAIALAGLALINLSYPLPLNAQRALSFLPGTWDAELKQSGERSTEWRVEMWEAALFTDYYIKNKILGDGLGLTREEMERIQDLQEKQNQRTSSGLTIQQESMMITGGYHSGPVQTIRAIGYVGLLIMWLAMIRMMVHMHRIIQQSRGTEWFIPVLFFGLPIMAWPIFWTFIFGEFRTGAFHVFLWSGMIDLLRKNLPLAWVLKPSRYASPATRVLPAPMHARARV